ncbi:hypothetical protein CYMTET_48475 [Cymbomonas tetramitiformis]|uniref:Uncharacterized protein n=1 Tax=Cymbomonas tetramitiformis TaxID=36881 RepID=A0AAE0EV45_9CHLO|nr:hypothetical protein CYMTET_48475 [Cymbomonas tetramitiformis]
MGHLEDPVAPEQLREDFRNSVNVNEGQRIFRKLTPVQGSTRVRTEQDSKRFINDLVPGSAWERRAVRLGGEVGRLATQHLGIGPLQVRSGPMTRTALTTIAGAEI